MPTTLLHPSSGTASTDGVPIDERDAMRAIRGFEGYYPVGSPVSEPTVVDRCDRRRERLSGR